MLIRVPVSSSSLNRLVRRRGSALIEYKGAEFWLAGVDDLTEGRPVLADALDGLRENEPVVLLAHHPDFFYEAAAVDIDLTLSGHTHGGQVRLFGHAPIAHSRFGYLAGEYNEIESMLYVSRGAGLTLLPIRIGAPAEIPIVTLHTDEPD